MMPTNKPKGGKSEGEKTEDVYKRLIKQQKEQIALQGQNTELAKVKYQVSQGELVTLTEAQKQTLLQNAALIDQRKIREQLAYEANLADANASARLQTRQNSQDTGRVAVCVRECRKCCVSGKSSSIKMWIFSGSFRLAISLKTCSGRSWN
jgi:phage-related minor tail protein